jgi:hypothetical protein
MVVRESLFVQRESILAIHVSRFTSPLGSRQHLKFRHLPMLDFCVEQHWTDPSSVGSSLCRLFEDRPEFTIRNILSAKAADERTQRARSQRFVIETSRNFLKKYAPLSWG